METVAEDKTVNYGERSGEPGSESGTVVTLRRVIVMPTIMHWLIKSIEMPADKAERSRLLADLRRNYESCISDGSLIAFVATAGGHDCGFGCISFEEGSRRGIIVNFYVSHGVDSAGIARALMDRLLDEADNRRCECVCLEPVNFRQACGSQKISP